MCQLSIAMSKELKLQSLTHPAWLGATHHHPLTQARHVQMSSLRSTSRLPSIPLYANPELRSRGAEQARRPQRLLAGGGLGAGSGGDDEAERLGFWEGEEGTKKLDEIEELRQLLQERKELEETLRSQEKGQVDADLEARAKERAEKLRKLLEKRAQEQAEKRRLAQDLFQAGMRAYGRGVYDQSVKILEAALTNVESGSRLGGEIQIWLAMAYDANGQRSSCIGLYKRLENNHPMPAIRKQAYDLRYITEAPKLKLSPDEILTVPILDRDNRSNTKKWSEMVRDRKPKQPKKKTGSRDYLEDLTMWKRPRWEKSPYFWVALTVWLTMVAVALVFQD